jgi:hypothetical protein
MVMVTANFHGGAALWVRPHNRLDQVSGLDGRHPDQYMWAEDLVLVDENKLFAETA